jgi:hypothetical protein
METQTPSHRTGAARLGTFEGFNFRRQCAIERTLTVEEVIHWEHDADGEAEFWPAGDCRLLSALFGGRNTVTGTELRQVVALLDASDGDDEETLLRLYFLVNVQEVDWEAITASTLEDMNVHLFRGSCFLDARKAAAFELFELYWPELYAVWEKTPMDGLRFETSDFRDSTLWQTEEIDLGRANVVLVTPYG